MQMKFQNQVKMHFVHNWSGLLLSRFFCIHMLRYPRRFPMSCNTPSQLSHKQPCVVQFNVLSISVEACLHENQRVAAGCRVVDNPARTVGAISGPLTCKCALYTRSVQAVQHNHTRQR